MKNNIEILENIMKPYFEKQEELKKNKENENANLNVLKLRLEKLMDNKEREIQEYIDEAMNSRSNFYSGYGAMIRKDLELAYKEREDSLRAEIEKLEHSSNFDRVDIKEIINIKDSLRPKLYQERKRLDFELRQQQINFDSIMLELSNFKYEYNDQHQVINGDSWRKLYEESNDIADKIRDIRNAINQVDEYLKLTELTKEEISVGMMSLTPWEQAEYDRRLELKRAKIEVEELKEEIDNSDTIETENLNDEEVTTSENIDTEEIGVLEEEPQNYNNLDEETITIQQEEVIDLDSLDEEVFSTIPTTPTNPDEEFIDISNMTGNPYTEIDFVDDDFDKDTELSNEDMIIVDEPIESNYEEIDGKMVVQTYDDLLMTVYNEIMEEIQDIRTVRLNASKERLSNDKYYISAKNDANTDYKNVGTVENVNSMKLSTGEYINEDDFNEALKNYYAKDKGKTFVVKEVNKEYKITRGTIRKFKKQLKKCTALKLVEDEKISVFDSLRVFGQERNTKEIQDLGQIESRVEDMAGDYINRNELIAKLDNTFKTKKTTWLKRVADKFRSKKEYEDDIEVYDAELVEGPKMR